MTTLARLCAIVYTTICLTTCWLEGNFQIIDDYNWFVRSMGRMVNELETELEYIKEDGGIIMKEGFMMLIFQGIMYEIPPFEKYWTHMFQNSSMHLVGECQSNILKFNRPRNEIFLPEDNKNKDTSAMKGEMSFTADKALLANIQDKKNPRQSICQVLGEGSIRIIHPMMTMWLVCSKWQSTILLKYLFGTMKVHIGKPATPRHI